MRWVFIENTRRRRVVQMIWRQQHVFIQIFLPKWNANSERNERRRKMWISLNLRCLTQTTQNIKKKKKHIYIHAKYGWLSVIRLYLSLSYTFFLVSFYVERKHWLTPTHENYYIFRLRNSSQFQWIWNNRTVNDTKNAIKTRFIS